MGYGDGLGLFARAIAKAALLSVSYLAIDIASDGFSHAQTAQQGTATQSAPWPPPPPQIAESPPSQLPPVQIDEQTGKQKRQRSQPSNRAGATAARRTTTPQPTPVAAA